MKKSLVLAVILPVVFVASANAQVTLYKGIKSGMSESELTAYLASDPDFTYEKITDDLDYYKITISGKLYFFRSGFNKYSELYFVDFISGANYPSVSDAGLRANVEELAGILRERYGEPFYEGWNDLSRFSDDNESIVYMFGASPDVGCITIEENRDGTYSAAVAYEDVTREILDEDDSVAADTAATDIEDYIF